MMPARGQFWWGVAPCKGVGDSGQLFQNYWFVGLGARVEKMLGAERRAASGGIVRETAKGNVYVIGVYQKGQLGVGSSEDMRVQER